MSLNNLFNGTVVVIDDEINAKDANVNLIISQIKSNNLPIITYTELPKNHQIPHFHSISFLILDWNLTPIPTEEVIDQKPDAESSLTENLWNESMDAKFSIPDTIKISMEKANIDFLKEFIGIVFCPIFIFTNENVSDIKQKLIVNNLMKAGEKSQIFVKSKAELIPRGTPAESNPVDGTPVDGTPVESTPVDSIPAESAPSESAPEESNLLETVLNEWLISHPSIAVLKAWEKHYRIAKKNLFADFHAINPNWPQIMLKSYQDDGVDPSVELGELISRNLQARLAPVKITLPDLSNPASVPQNDLKFILEGAKCLKKTILVEDDIAPGDLFRIDEADAASRYYLNIRAQCDLKGTDSELYIIEGMLMQLKDNGNLTSPANNNVRVEFNKGTYLEKVNEAIVPFVDDGRIIRFNFSKFEIKKWNELKDYRIGRLISPYVDKIQQRFAYYIQRPGLPAIPEGAVKVYPKVFADSTPSKPE